MDIQDIILAHLNGEKLNPEEKTIFEKWYAQPENQEQYYKLRKIQTAIYAERYKAEETTNQSWERLKVRIQPHFTLHYLYACAAVILLLLGISSVLYFYIPEEKTISLAELPQTVLPGYRQAVLTLSNGQEIPLGASVEQVKEAGAIIQNDSNNVLAYQAADTTLTITYNKIRTPRGGEYQLKLSDGTIVWLNAESSLTYPVVFTGNTRTLTLDGEAYFQVARDTSHPFIVHTSKFDVRVTGTEFNVSTYPEDYESATLVEGGILLECSKQNHLLKPGQQFRLKGDVQEVIPIDPEVVTAWHHAIFNFKERRLESLLNELARWYDFDIIYLNQEVKNYHFTAWFKRSCTLPEVIKILEKTNKIKLNLEGKTLTVIN